MKGQFRASWINLQRMADKKGWKTEQKENIAMFEAKFTDDTLASRIKHWSKQHKGTGIGYGHVLGQLAVHMKEMGWNKSFKEVARIAVELGHKKTVESVNEDWWSDMPSDQQDAYIKKHPGSKQAKNAKKKEEPKEKSASRKGVDKLTSGTKAFSGKDTQETFDNIVNDENQRGRDIIDYGNMKAPLSARQHDNLVKGKRTAHLVKSRDPADKLKLLRVMSNMVKKNTKKESVKKVKKHIKLLMIYLIRYES
jgi:hypothetical protein